MNTLYYGFQLIVQGICYVLKLLRASYLGLLLGLLLLVIMNYHELLRFYYDFTGMLLGLKASQGFQLGKVHLRERLHASGFFGAVSSSKPRGCTV